MTNSMALPITTTETAKSTEMFLVTANLIKTVAHYQVKMEKSRHQLTLIEKANEGSTIGRKAEKFLQRQNKLEEIADNLKLKMIEQIGFGTITKEMENEFIQEVDLLNWMHFEVAKSYASFVQQNFEARIISLMKPIAA